MHHSSFLTSKLSSAAKKYIVNLLYYSESVLPPYFQIWVYGNSFESYLVAVVNPNKQAIEKWAEENGVPGDFNSLCENPKVKEYMLGEFAKLAKEKKVLSCVNCALLTS